MVEIKITDVDVIERVELELGEEAEVKDIEQSLKRKLIDRGHSASAVEIGRTLFGSRLLVGGELAL